MPRVRFALSPRAYFTSFLFLLAAGPVFSQGVPPRLNQIHPLGGQKGTSFEVTVTGQFIENAETLHFSFPGVKAEPVGASEKVDPKIDPKIKGMKGPTGPQVSQKFKVTLPADAPLGIQDLRLVTKNGISNPRAFVVGDLPEVEEKESNDDVPLAQKVPLNSSVSGVIGVPTDVDYFLFSGKKGQRVVISCLTTSVDSKLPAQLQLYGSSGAYLGLGRGYWNNDALLDAALPADGDYFVRLSSFTYTVGGPDYFYRLTISTTPWIDAVDPVAVEPGKETKVTVWGRNLPGGVADPSAQVDGRVLEKATLTVKAPSDPRKVRRLEYTGAIFPLAGALDGMELRLKNEAGSSNPFLLTYTRGPIISDGGDNDTLEKAQKLTLPSEVSGRIEKKGDKDWYRFSVKKGETIAVEVLGERLGAAHDLFFQVRDDKGKTFPEQDENPDIASNAFFTRNEDPPVFKFTAPADGDYFLMISTREAFSLAGPRQFYLARIGPEAPDFRLVAMPAATAPEGITMGQGGHNALGVLAFREGGFNGEITLTAEALPPGVTMPAQKIAFGQKSGAFVLSAAPEAPPVVAPFRVIGTATIGGKKVVREVRSASITWPAPAGVTTFISRLDRELVLAVKGQAPYRLAAEKTSISVLQGEKINIPVTFSAISPDFKTAVQVTVLNPPPGLISPPLTLALDKKTGILGLDSKTPPPPGVYTLVLRGQTAPLGKAPPPKGPLPPNFIQVAPPVTLTIVPKQLAKLTAEKAPKLVPGKTGELVIRLERQFDFPGAFKLEVISPKMEITAAPASIKEGENEVRIVLTAAQEVKSGTVVPLTIRATALFNDVPVVHEIKGVTVTVTK